MGCDEDKALFRVGDFLDEIRDFRRHGITRGEEIGWPCMDELYRVQPGYMTVVTGIPGHGKSEVVDGIMVNLAARLGWKFLLFSPENYPLSRHFVKLSEKLIGKQFRTFSGSELAAAVEWVGDHFVWMYPKEDDLSLGNILKNAEEAIRHYGVKGLVLDPWNEIDHQRPNNLSETEYISKSLTSVRRFARQHQIHTWIVAHPTKLQKNRESGAYDPPTPYDISGSAHWRNKADFCLTVHRYDMGEQQVTVIVNKVKFKEMGKLGNADLDYDFTSGRLKDISAPKFELPQGEGAPF